MAQGCGGSQKHVAQQLQEESVLSNTAPLSDRLITQSEIRSASDEKALQTFLQVWSLLQFESWDQAAQLFEPGLRRAIGTALLAQALETDVAVWQSTKPRIVTTRVSGGTATVAFLSRNEHGSVAPGSISFGGGPGKWRVAYFSLLNPAIARSVELRVQSSLDPLGTKASPEAVRQANKAATIQGKYLEQKLAAANAKP